MQYRTCTGTLSTPETGTSRALHFSSETTGVHGITRAISRGIGASGAFASAIVTAGSCGAGFSAGALTHGHDPPQQQLFSSVLHDGGASGTADAAGTNAHNIITNA